MRLRLTVVPQRDGTNELFQVRLDLLNVTDQPIGLVAEWPYDPGQESFTDYLEAAVSFETSPAICPSMDQVASGPERIAPPPEYALAAREALSLQWTASGRQLHKRLTVHYDATTGPRFPTDGLYGVHANLVLRPAGGASRGPVLLRSNEEQVPVGGSHALPKHPLGRLTWVDTNQQTAAIDLGALQRIEAGDRFAIHTGLLAHRWILKITKVEPRFAHGELEPITQYGSRVVQPDPKFLKKGALAELITGKNPRGR